MKSIYFIGAGGIGMSALERYYNKKGYKVGGYDKTPSALTDALVKEGIDSHLFRKASFRVRCGRIHNRINMNLDIFSISHKYQLLSYYSIKWNSRQNAPDFLYNY